MKKVCIKNQEFNTNYHLVYSEENAIADGYSVFEVPQEYEDCAFEDFDSNGFSIDKYNARKNKYLLLQEEAELVNWFDKYFQPQLIQSLWQTDFKVSEDPYFKDENGEFKTYNTIEELKEQGEIVRFRIRKIRDLLNSN